MAPIQAMSKATLRAGLSGLLTVASLGACVEVEIDGKPPMAEAGPDQSFPDDNRVTVTLDGSESTDHDGTIVDYQWRYTGDPRGDAAPPADEDAGAPEHDNPANPNLRLLMLDTLPEFCPDVVPDDIVVAARRWCELEPSGEPEVSVELTTGVYRFTLYVTDDDGMVSTDSVVISVGQP